MTGALREVIVVFFLFIHLNSLRGVQCCQPRSNESNADGKFSSGGRMVAPST